MQDGDTVWTRDEGSRIEVWQGMQDGDREWGKGVCQGMQNGERRMGTRYGPGTRTSGWGCGRDAG